MKRAKIAAVDGDVRCVRIMQPAYAGQGATVFHCRIDRRLYLRGIGVARMAVQRPEGAGAPTTLLPT